MHFLVDVVLDHVKVVLDFECFEAYFIQVFAGYLPAENLASNKISSQEHQLHLVQDEGQLVSHRQRPIRLNLDLLDDLGGFFLFAVLFKHVT